MSLLKKIFTRIVFACAIVSLIMTIAIGIATNAVTNLVNVDGAAGVILTIIVCVLVFIFGTLVLTFIASIAVVLTAIFLVVIDTGRASEEEIATDTARFERLEALRAARRNRPNAGSASGPKGAS